MELTLKEFQKEETRYQYPIFQENQVLTQAQLNNMREYLDNQQRLNRVFLHGVGIVCGLHLNLTKGNGITIANGCGVTTDGDLLFINNNKEEAQGRHYSFYRKFESGDNKYSKFPENPSNDEDEVKIWELLESEPEDDQSVTFLSEFSDNEPGEKVVVLYLERRENDPDLCDPISCDDLGKSCHFKQRVLLIDAEYIDQLMGKNGEAAFHLDPIPLKRPDLTNVETPQALRNAYAEVINSLNKEKLETQVDKIEKLLKLNYPIGEQPEQFSQFITRHANAEKGFQYHYDIVKDWLDTYEELRQLLPDMADECLPSFKDFPRHLVLGKVKLTEGGFQLDEDTVKYRHAFYPSQVQQQQKHNLKRAEMLLMRLNRIFYERNYNQSALEADGTLPIKITPSLAPGNKLSNKSIPFYYKYSGLKNSWNYDLLRRHYSNGNLSYHQQDNDEAAPQVQSPLNYNLDQYDFFRIEGHQGKQLKEAEAEIKAIRDRQNLPFEVVAVSLSGNFIRRRFPSHFKDIDNRFAQWKGEFDYWIKDAIQFFTGINFKAENDDAPPFLKQNDWIGSGIINNTIGRIGGLGRSSNSLNSPQGNFSSLLALGEPPKKNAPYASLIKEYISSEEGEFGYYLCHAQSKKEENPNLETQIVNLIHYQNSFLSNLRNLNEKEQEVFVRIPLEITELADKLVKNRPARIEELDSSSLENFSNTLKEQCDKIDSMIKEANAIWDNDKWHAFARLYFQRLYQLKTLCSKQEELKVILDELQRKKKQLTLSGFMESHPGLEHQAGVHKGGTFVLVYDDRPEEDNFGGASTEEGNMSGPGTIPDYTLEEPINLPDRIPEIPNVENLPFNPFPEMESSFGGPYRVPLLTFNNYVVADFCLPYVCCLEVSEDIRNECLSSAINQIEKIRDKLKNLQTDVIKEWIEKIVNNTNKVLGDAKYHLKKPGKVITGLEQISYDLFWKENGPFYSINNFDEASKEARMMYGYINILYIAYHLCSKQEFQLPKYMSPFQDYLENDENFQVFPDSYRKEWRNYLKEFKEHVDPEANPRLNGYILILLKLL